MKKTVFLLICFFVFSLCLSAQGQITWAEEEAVQEIETEPENVFVYPITALAWTENEETLTENVSEKKEKKQRRTYRKFEFGLANLSFNFSNDYVSSRQFFQDVVVFDLNELKEGLGINFGLGFSPIFFNYNSDKNWGWGLYTGLDLIGALRISGEMLTLSEAKDSPSAVGGAAFFEVAVPFYFPVNKFKVKIRPAVYYPLLYVTGPDNNTPAVVYTFDTTTKNETAQTLLYMDVNMRVFTAVSMETFDTALDITAKPGVDFNIGIEYPLSQAIGLTDLFPFLDFDVGVDLINIPLYPSTMYNFMRTTMRIGSDEDPIDFFGSEGMNSDNFIEFGDDEDIYGVEQFRVVRPFKMHAWAHWRPFESNTISFIPTLGFAINPIYYQPFSFDGGVKTRFDLSNVFITTFGVGYLDRVWKNSLDLCLNLRVFELNLGLSLQSPKFLKSWAGGGFGVDLGLIFGW